jgi:hypothetical protein
MPASGQDTPQAFAQPLVGVYVRRSFWHLGDQPSFQKFHAIVVIQNADANHLVILFDGKPKYVLRRHGGRQAVGAGRR